MKGKIIAFDLDDTLCKRPKDIEYLGVDKYLYCEPINEIIEICNKLYDKGNTIYIYTARGMGQFNGNAHAAQIALYELTLNSLKEWGVKHHGLIMGKIHYDLFIDDKCMNLDDIEKIKNL